MKKLDKTIALESRSSVLKKVGFRVVALLSVVILCIVGISAVFFIYQTRTVSISYEPEQVHEEEVIPQTFPIGVDPAQKEITENPILDTYLETHVSTLKVSNGKHTTWIGRAIGKLALLPLYQNLASVSERTLVIQSGERKEQVAENFTKILGWSKNEKQEFIDLIEGIEPPLDEGKYFPGVYRVARGAKPPAVASLVIERFTNEVLNRYTKEVDAVVPLEEALIIASLLEREAYDFTDMREISGVIWNRLFADMKLQIDATLQYAKGSRATEPWWPRVRPSDKYIVSAYNTYKNEGLPPAPIANPSIDAIIAALNPKDTDCFYYFHDADAGFHCTETYEEHVALLKQYYGRGK